ncbi:acetyl-CoA C-acyltransferase [Ascoidea rubescens DSM 1968]|uniref:acetyl-CoA C-acyltransferase n=1 Tax=Ascoidea rubescens DSM 1968 TaxID=1344418 RepID=A0A1D2VM34_9ASCO|nr:3-ketoacyl-CoA thiolase with broad chain length specificity [Ascoidea rubescens DSM 1968]ODV62673.1 3-ketoacyl-CoA thiolase with broad chain length specificity [Ascoidea rubescens DSM 1968]
MDRLSQIASHLLPTSNTVVDLKSKNPGDVVIVSAYRTAITKGGRGSFKSLKSEDILYYLLKKFNDLKIVSPKLVEEITVGNVLNKGAGANEHRAACLAAGFPKEVPVLALNRQCSSGLMAVNDIANKIIANQIDIGLACGVESMSTFFGPSAVYQLSDTLSKDKEATKCLIPMGITNENVAEKFGISRKEQDKFSAASYQKAEKALKNNLFKNEILSLEIELEEENDNDDDDDDEDDENDNAEKKVTNKIKHKLVVDRDEGPRMNVTPESLSKIRPAFKKNGVTHAGNASQVSDGAALVLLMKRSVAESLDLKPIGKYIGCVSVGVAPEIMGVGPAYAIPKVLTKFKLSADDIKIFEINEAFAAQCLYSIHTCNIPMEKVNPRGGAIALGHPLGATGARQVSTLLNQLQDGEIGLTSMCVGSGMGAAALFAKEG